MLIDSHAHIDMSHFVNDLDEVLQRAQEQGLKAIINVGIDESSSRAAVALADKYSQVYAAVGIHPHDAKNAGKDVIVALSELALHPKVVAIGEMGLDYYRNLSPRLVQQKMFRQQIELAKQLRKPIIVHDRDAHADTLKILKEQRAIEVGGVMHCYSGSWELAQEYLKMGFYLSFAGPVTYGNARKLQEVARKMPLDRILVETDCPFLTPVPYRGKRNEPSYVVKTAEKIAQLKGINFEELAKHTTENTMRLFNISSDTRNITE
jgi:TatD DNase family protein